jgi:transposase-like protein
MPWIQTEPEMERRKFVQAALRRDVPMSELCQRFGISRKMDLKDAEAARGSGPPRASRCLAGTEDAPQPDAA